MAAISSGIISINLIGFAARAQAGPAIVAGHSYGAEIMTALGTDAPNVAGPV